MTQTSSPFGSTLNEQELDAFSPHAASWWDPNGPFKMLHALNPLRLDFMKGHLPSHKISILDVGCGGGLVSLAMAKDGHQVTGIDADKQGVLVAQNKAEEEHIPVTFIHGCVEDLPETTLYEGIIALEIIEHVQDVPSFIHHLATRLKPGGLLFISTLNRTVASFLGGIVMAEYVLNWVPRGTHSWRQFIRPRTLSEALEPYHMTLQDLKGISYIPLWGTWRLSEDVRMNYITCFQKSVLFQE